MSIKQNKNATQTFEKYWINVISKYNIIFAFLIWSFLLIWLYNNIKLLNVIQYLYKYKNRNSCFILGGLNSYVITIKLIIWYNAVNVYIHVFTLYLYYKIYLYVIKLHAGILICN